MPDPTRQTVSASQMPALFDQSPYATRWQLYQEMKNGIAHQTPENEYMEWGTRMQPVLLQWARENLRLDVQPNVGDVYFRHPTLPIGCTDDGFAREQRGCVKVETKNVSVQAWRDTWDGGDRVPVHIEIQHQQQLMIPHPEWGPPVAGFIVALVGGNEVKVFQRGPIDDLQAEIGAQALGFFADVAANREPPLVTGTETENKVLARIFPPSALKKLDVLDLRGADNEGEVAQLLSEYSFFRNQKTFSEKAADSCKAKILRLIENAGALRVNGFELKVSKSDIAPQEIGLPAEHKAALMNGDKDGVRRCLEWVHTAKVAHIRTLLTVNQIPGETPAAIKHDITQTTIAS